MRNLLICFVILYLLFPADTKADLPITVSEQTHWIQGSTNADIDSESSFDIRYPEDTLLLPLEGACYGIWSNGSDEILIDPAASARISNFSVYTFAEGTLDEEMTTFAHAWSKYTFSPVSDSLKVAFFSPSATTMDEGIADFSFWDLTELVMLEEWNSEPDSREGIDLIQTYSVNPLHEYELILECYSFGDHTTSGDLVNSITVMIVPEPSVLLLLGIGAALMRNRRK